MRDVEEPQIISEPDSKLAQHIEQSVAKAILHFEQVGVEAALNDFNSTPDKFAFKDNYLFVSNPQTHQMLATGNRADQALFLNHPFAGYPMQAQANILASHAFTQETEHIWLSFPWHSPTDSEMHYKIAYCRRYAGLLFGMGYYPEE